MEGKALLSMVNGITQLWRKPAAAMQQVPLGFASRVLACGKSCTGLGSLLTW